jgi:hypothetical protein
MLSENKKLKEEINMQNILRTTDFNVNFVPRNKTTQTSAPQPFSNHETSSQTMQPPPSQSTSPPHFGNNETILFRSNGNMPVLSNFYPTQLLF